MKRYLDIRGSCVVNRNGEEKGIIEDCLFDYKNKRICSMVVINKSFFAHSYLIKFSSIQSMEDVLIYDDKLYEIDKGVLNRHRKIMFQSFIDREIIDSAGRGIGEMKDAILDEDTGIVKAIISSRGFIDDVFDGRKVIFVNENTVFGPDKIITTDNAVDMYNDMSIWKLTRG